MNIYTGLLVFLLFLPASLGGYTCLSCKGAVIPKDCDTIARCGDSEQCFVDTYASSLGYIRFDLGCRDAHQCIGASSPGRRRYSSSDRLLRSSCCTDNLCNAVAGTLSGYPNPRGPVCFACGSQGHYDSCSHIRMCGENEKCFIRSRVGHDGLFETGCERDTVCATGTLVGKRASSLNCAECCDGDLCNDKCLNQGIKLSPCDHQPCLNGKCYEVANSFVCQCYDSYDGAKCENRLTADQCLSNPCAFGTCHSYSTYYSCTCMPGYTGVHCDVSHINPCANSPCIHGTCFRQDPGYVCQCDQGYTGKNCATAQYNPCQSGPCVQGTCTQLGIGYKCTCYLGYTGTNCERPPMTTATTTTTPATTPTTPTTTPATTTTTTTISTTTTTTHAPLANPCMSNPCLGGDCYALHGHEYFCKCHTGYTGQHCESLEHDPCASNPCVHGICSQTGGIDSDTFNCTCSGDYTGLLCDKGCPAIDPTCHGGAVCIVLAMIDNTYCKVCRDDCKNATFTD